MLEEGICTRDKQINIVFIISWGRALSFIMGAPVISCSIADYSHLEAQTTMLLCPWIVWVRNWKGKASVSCSYSVMSRTSTGNDLMTVSWDLSWDSQPEYILWSLHVAARASSQYGGWVLGVSVPRKPGRNFSIFHGSTSEVMWDHFCQSLKPVQIWDDGRSAKTIL